MPTREYVGARYVPKFYTNSVNPTSCEWEENTSYESMTVVTYNNSSYTSKIPVPPTVGIPSQNSDYWALTGNYNGQVEEYRKSVANLTLKNVEELKESNANSEEKISTSGYYKENDGGGSDYIIVNVKPNGYYIELNNGNFAVPIIGSVPNFKVFGGSEENTAEKNANILQSMLNWYNNIFIPYGKYNFDSVNIEKDNVSIKSDNATINIKTKGFIFTKSVSLFNLNNITIEGGDNALYALGEFYVERSTIENCTFLKQKNYSIYFNEASLIITNITNTIFRECYGGIYLNSNANNLNNITRCRFEEITKSSIFVDQSNNNEQLTCINWIINGCRFEAPGQGRNDPVIILDNCFNIDLSYNYFENCTDTEYLLIGNSGGVECVRITGNMFYDHATPNNIVINLPGFFNDSFIGHNILNLNDSGKIKITNNSKNSIFVENSFFGGFEGTPGECSLNTFNFRTNMDMTLADNKNISVTLGKYLFNTTIGTNGISSNENYIDVELLGTHYYRFEPDNLILLGTQGLVMHDSNNIAYTVKIGTDGQLKVTKN